MRDLNLSGKVVRLAAHSLWVGPLVFVTAVSLHWVWGLVLVSLCMLVAAALLRLAMVKGAVRRTWLLTMTVGAGVALGVLFVPVGAVLMAVSNNTAWDQPAGVSGGAPPGRPVAPAAPVTH